MRTADLDIYAMEDRCAEVIAQKVMEGDPAWSDDFRNDYAGEVAMIVSNALAEAAKNGKEDAVTMGFISSRVEELAKQYADGYMKAHRDIQAVAYQLGIDEEEF